MAVLVKFLMDYSDKSDYRNEWHSVKDAIAIANQYHRSELEHPDLWVEFFDKQGREIYEVFNMDDEVVNFTYDINLHNASIGA